MRSLNHSLRDVDCPEVDLPMTRHWVGHGALVMIRQVLLHFEKSVSENELEQMYQSFLEHYERNIANFSEPYPGAKDVLLKLKSSGIRTGVVTNKKYHLSYLLLRALDLYPCIDVLVGGDTMQVAKPAPEPIRYACNELNLSVAQTLFVGDSITDVQAARAAGCDVVCVRDGYNHGTPADQLGADRVIDSFWDLLDSAQLEVPVR